MFHNLYKKHPQLNFKHSIDSTTFARNLAHDVYSFDFILDNISNVRVSNDATFDQVRPYLLEFLQANLDFVAQYQRLQQFYEMGETMDLKDNINFYSSPPPQKRLIIKKLVGVPYQDKADQLIQHFTTRNELEKVAFTQTVVEFLDNM